MLNLTCINEWDSVAEELAKQGKSIEGVYAGDVDVDPLLYDRIIAIRKSSPNFFSRLIHSFIPEPINEPEAQTLWDEIQVHKKELQQKLGRNVGLRVAALDYLENFKHKLKKSYFVEANVFLETFDEAQHDALTGLLNRKYFYKHINNLINENSSFTFAFIDLDNFKKHNDRFGHLHGDNVLKDFSQKIKIFFSENALMGRYGGDEFMLCLPGIPKDRAFDQLDLFRRQFAEKHAENLITMSTGLVEYKLDADSTDSLLAIADELLYRVKEFGGNKVFTLQSQVFRFHSDSESEYKDVAVVGDFNNWDRKKGTMTFDPETQIWQSTLLLKPGQYRYKFLIDTNIWLADPQCHETADDGFGGVCSLITIGFN
jgi:diguanylate cyclase (GGDEF)-like protein